MANISKKIRKNDHTSNVSTMNISEPSPLTPKEKHTKYR